MPTTTNYIWDEENLLAEADASNVVQTVYTNEPQQYGNLVSSRISGATSYHHFDAIGSTRQLTNAVGATTDNVDYGAWGNVISRTGMTATPLLWIGAVGYYFDVETSQFDIRERTYLPHIGRWTSIDPLHVTIGIADFRYVDNMPAVAIDPSGLCRVCGGGVVHFAGSFYQLDYFLAGQPHQRLGDWAVSSYQTAAWRFFGFNVPNLTSAGPYKARNAYVNADIPANTQELAFLLYFVEWNVCQDDGPCSLSLDERGSSWTWYRWNDSPGIEFRTGDDQDPLPLKGQHWDIAESTYLSHGDTCRERLIFVDAPGYKSNIKTLSLIPSRPNADWEYVRGGIVGKVHQVLTVKDMAGHEIDSRSVHVGIAIDKFGTVTFSY